MKIALIKPPSTYADWYKRPLHGLTYIAACIEQKGFECKIFDAHYHFWSTKDLLARVKDYKPDVIGFTAMTHEVVQTAKLASLLKSELPAITIIGGCHVTALPERTLTEFPVFDYGVHGEGEVTVPELLEHISQGKLLEGIESIKGIIFRDGRQIIVTGRRAFLASAELDQLPYPAFHHYYGDNPRALINKRSFYPLMTSRGCPHSCNFCMQVLGKKVRQRSAENVYHEMEYAIERYGAHTFSFADEIFLSDNKETRKLLHMMIYGGLPERGIRWRAQTYAKYVNWELISLAKEAGCYSLSMGVESGDEQILENMGKRITVEQVREAVRVIKAVGISLSAQFILGHPYETRESIRKTIRLATELNTDTIAVGLMVPYPGTQIYSMAVRGEGGYRLLTKNWSEYDKYGGRALEVQGLPHKELRKWQRRAYLVFYVKNLRFRDSLRFALERKRALGFFLKNLFVRGWKKVHPRTLSQTQR